MSQWVQTCSVLLSCVADSNGEWGLVYCLQCSKSTNHTRNNSRGFRVQEHGSFALNGACEPDARMTKEAKDRLDSPSHRNQSLHSRDIYEEDDMRRG